MVYVWTGNSLKTTLPIKNGGIISALKFFSGSLYIGDKTGTISKMNTSNYEITQRFSVPSMPRAIDIDLTGTFLITGMKNGTIVQLNLDSEE